MYLLEDMWGDDVQAGDTVIASRPAGAGTTMLEYCEVVKVNQKSVRLRSLDRNGQTKTPKWSWEAPEFNLQKRPRADQCVKIVKYKA